MYSAESMAAKQRVREAFAQENRLNRGGIFRDGSY